ncbi:MAG: pre-peptidase C-terminal domain-containing protein, partial [Planctomycetota bacterium]
MKQSMVRPMKNAWLPAIIAVIAFGAGVLNAVTADLYEPDNTFATAKPITVGVSQTHNIHIAGDYDYLTFTLTDTRRVVLETSGVSGDSYLYLYTSTQSQLASDDDSGSGYWSRIDRVLNPGQYYVMVRAYSSSSTIDSYSLLITATIVVPPTIVTTVSSISVSSYEGATVPSQSFGIRIADYVSNTTITITENATWLSTSYSSYTFSGTGTTTFYAYINTTGLSAGTYNATITLTSPSVTNSPVTIPVQLTILTVNPDAYEPDNNVSTATVLTSGTVQTHTIHTPTDSDYYRFTLSQTSLVELTTSGTLGDTIMVLYDSSDVELRMNDNGPSGTFSRIAATLPAGTYYAKVYENGQNAVIPTYAMQASILTGQWPQIEVLPATVNYTAFVGSSSGSSFIMVRNAGVGTMNYTISDNMTWLSASPTSGSSIGETDSIGLTFSISSLAIGSYSGIITVASTEAIMSPVEIPVSLNIIGLPADSWEPDDNAANATALIPGISQSHSINEPDDEDWVMFTVSTTSYAVIETSGSTGDTRMDLYNASLVLIEWDDYDGTGDFSRIDRHLDPGTYFVRIIEDGQNAVIASYLMSLSLTPQIGPRIDLSASTLVVTAYTGISPTAGSVTIRNGATTDYLYYTITDDVTWLSCSPTSGSSYGETDSITLTFTTTSLAIGTYTGTITVSSAEASNSPATIAVVLNVVAVTMDAYEPDNNSSTATLLTPGAPQNHCIHMNGDQDWYRFTLTEGSIVILETSGASGDTAMSLYNSSQSLLQTDYNSGTGNFSRIETYLTAGTYYVMVCENGQNAAIPAYVMSLAATPSVAPTIELSVTSYDLSVAVGQNLSSRTFQIRAAPGTGTLSYSLTDSASWFYCSPTSGTSSGVWNTVTIYFSTSSLSGGVYNATITCTSALATNSPATITVRLTVSAPTMDSFEPDGTFATASTLVNDVPQTHSFHITSDSDYARFTLTADADVTLTAIGGSTDLIYLALYNSSQSQLTYSAATVDGTATVITRSLTAGTYYVLAQERYMDEIIYSYTLTLSIEVTGPYFGTSVTQIQSHCSVGQNPSPATFSVWNSGWDTLTWTAASSASWLSLSPANGTSIGASDSDTVTLTFSAASLAPGVYAATVTLTDPDAENSPFTITVSLVVTDPAAQSVLINEVSPNTPDWVEFYNPGSSPINMTGYQFLYEGDSAVQTYTFPSGFILPAGGYVTVYEFSGTNTATMLYTGNNMYWSSSLVGSVQLLDALGTGIDFVRWNNSTRTPPSGTTWSGANIGTPNDSSTLARDRFSTDTNTSSDWDITSGADATTPTPGAVNYTPSSVPAAPTGVTATGGSGQVTIHWNVSALATYYRVYYDDDGVYPPYSTTLPATQGASPVQVNAGTELTLTGLPNGTTYHIAVAAYNSIGSSPLSITVTATTINPAPEPNLRIESITHSPLTIAPGDTVTFLVGVRNAGAAESGMFSLGFWSNRTTAPVISDTPELEADVASIAPGAARIVSFSVTASTAQLFRAWAYADRYNGISEVNESNESDNAGPAGGHSWTVVIPPQTLTWSVAGNGSITRNPVGSNPTATSTSGSSDYAVGTVVQLTANPGVGYRFIGWNGQVANSSAASTTATMNSNIAVTARFELLPHTIFASAGTGGSISPNGSVSVSHGADQTFVFTSTSGYVLDFITVDGVQQGAPASYVFNDVTADHTISATFRTSVVTTHTIVSSCGPNGLISPRGTTTVAHGGSQSYLMTPATGYRVADVLVNGTSVGALTVYTFTNVTANRTISVTFEPNVLTVTATAGSGGVVSPAGSTACAWQSNLSLTIEPNPGHMILDVLVDGTSVGPVSTYAFQSIEADHSLEALFTQIQYAITASSGPGGLIAPVGTVIVTSGNSVSFTMTPNSGYAVSDVLIDGTSVGAVAAYTFTNVDRNHTINATFVSTARRLTWTSDTGGGVRRSPLGSNIVSPSAQGESNYANGTTVTVTAIPDSGYEFVGWMGPVSDPLAITATVTLTANKEIRALYRRIRYTLEWTTIGLGDITRTPTGDNPDSPSHAGSSTYNEGEVVALIAWPFPADGTVEFVEWLGPVADPHSPATSVTITGPTQITVVFRFVPRTLNWSTSAGGQISRLPLGSNLVSPSASGSSTYDLPDTAVTLTAIPDSGYVFREWVGAIDGFEDTALTDPDATVLMDSDRTIRAVFDLAPKVITATTGAHGAISPSGSVNVPLNSNQTFVFTPDPGYIVETVLVDSVSVFASSSYGFMNVTQDHTINVSFTYVGGVTHTIAVTYDAISVTITPPGPVITVADGASQTFIIEPLPGFEIFEICIDGAFMPPTDGWTFVCVIDDSHSISANGAPVSHFIGGSAGEGGSVW